MKSLLVFATLLAMAVLLTAAAATSPVTYVDHNKVAEVLAKGGALQSYWENITPNNIDALRNDLRQGLKSWLTLDARPTYK